MAETGSELRRRPRTVVAAILLVGLGGLTGCVSLPGDREMTDEKWTPATEDALAEWMQDYDQAMAESAQQLDEKPLQTLTGNVQHHSVRGEYRQAERTDGATPNPTVHQDPEFYLPELDEYPLHGLAVATNEETGGTVLDLLDRQGAGDDWRSLISVELGEGQELPELELDGETLVEPPLNEPGKLRRSPGQMARAFGGLVAATGDDSPFAVFGQHPLVDEHVEQNAEYDQAQNNGNLTMEHEAAEPMAVRAFQITDGGAVVLTGLREELTLQLSGGGVTFPDDVTASIEGLGAEPSVLNITYFWQVALLLPPESAGPETEPEILGAQRTLGKVDAATH